MTNCFPFVTGFAVTAYFGFYSLFLNFLTFINLCELCFIFPLPLIGTICFCISCFILLQCVSFFLFFVCQFLHSSGMIWEPKLEGSVGVFFWFCVFCIRFVIISHHLKFLFVSFCFLLSRVCVCVAIRVRLCGLVSLFVCFNSCQINFTRVVCVSVYVFCQCLYCFLLSFVLKRKDFTVTWRRSLLSASFVLLFV